MTLKIEKFLFTFEADGVILPDEKFVTTFELSIAKYRSVPRILTSRDLSPWSRFIGRSIGDLIGAGNDRLNLNGGQNAPTITECV